MREIVLDTETTGLDPASGHRIVEIGCVELYNHVPTGRTLQRLINPERPMPEAAFLVHGHSDEVLAKQPVFAKVVDELLEFIGDAPLVIHNAAFDMGFLNAELALLKREAIPDARAIDTVSMARRKFPGAPASLDALCKRFSIDLSARDKHGALLDAQLLAEVYLAMTAGQGLLGFGEETSEQVTRVASVRVQITVRPRVLRAFADEIAAHVARLEAIDKASKGACLWKRLAPPAAEPIAEALAV
jgi:DNA polymerase-3 subunit epsilon